MKLLRSALGYELCMVCGFLGGSIMIRSLLAVSVGGLALAACTTISTSERPASASLAPTAGNAVRGTVLFTQRDGRLLINADVTGLPPNGQHGFHIHERGDCSAPDASSAGAHFDPTRAAHGGPGERTHHAGDMPNLQADAAGRAQYRGELVGLVLSSGPHGVLGRSIIVHRDQDDYRTQPSGNSGPPVACGVVQR
jgi:superoxide dismutase, Cu-Zn family